MKFVILSKNQSPSKSSLSNIQVIQDQFAEHHVSPREPFTRVVSWVVHVEAFVHDTRATHRKQPADPARISSLPYLSLSNLG